MSGDDVATETPPRRRPWRAGFVCVAVVSALALVGILFGLGVAPWLIVMGGGCLLMMGVMLWMMIAMGKHATRDR